MEPEFDANIRAVKAQVRALMEANLECAPVYAKCCGELLKALQIEGFTREEAMAVVLKAFQGAK